MEWRWPLGLGLLLLLLLLCTPLPPGARAKEGTDPRSGSPLPWPARHPPPGAGIPEEAPPRAPLQRSRFIRRQGIDWPGQSLVFDPKQLLSRASHPRPCWAAVYAWGWGASSSVQTPTSAMRGAGGGVVPR